ncbi:MAG: cupin domain-containing protein [Candidatus Bruticola sp.]
MKKMLLSAAILSCCTGLAGAQELDQPFSPGQLNPYNKFFTGTTRLNVLSDYDEIWHSALANVTFEKGARTFWHSHSGGQILLVTAGEGRYQAEGEEIQILKRGDVVRIPPNVKHWHGAAPDSEFAHIAVTSNPADNKTTWMEPVSNQQYK